MPDKPTYEELEQQVRQLGGVVAGLERAEKVNQTLFRVSNAVNTTSNLDELYASIHAILNKVIDLHRAGDREKCKFRVGPVRISKRRTSVSDPIS